MLKCVPRSAFLIFLAQFFQRSPLGAGQIKQKYTLIKSSRIFIIVKSTKTGQKIDEIPWFLENATNWEFLAKSMKKKIPN